MDLGGRDITKYLQLLLRRSGYNFYTTAELEVVRLIKESCCVVATNASELEILHSNATHGSSSSSSISSSSNQTKTSYSLPDGNVVDVSITFLIIYIFLKLIMVIIIWRFISHWFTCS